MGAAVDKAACLVNQRRPPPSCAFVGIAKGNPGPNMRHLFVQSIAHRLAAGVHICEAGQEGGATTRSIASAKI